MMIIFIILLFKNCHMLEQDKTHSEKKTHFQKEKECMEAKRIESVYIVVIRMLFFNYLVSSFTNLVRIKELITV